MKRIQITFSNPVAARGVPLHDIASRLQRLLREASEIDANRP